MYLTLTKKQKCAFGVEKIVLFLISGTYGLATTINANDSALMSSIPATLGSPAIHLNSGLNSGSKSRNQPIVSESFDKRKILKDRFLSSPRTLRVETMDSVNSGAKFNLKFSTNKNLDANGFMH